ncbi:hypothetical protein T484DRAFT_1811110 [Baffinella frigidus]|nr:hypothetical protein T484DRAFT_1811110 [Cryptophyta sp. CCMP2293]
MSLRIGLLIALWFQHLIFQPIGVGGALWFRHLVFQPIGVGGVNSFQRSLYLLASWSAAAALLSVFFFSEETPPAGIQLSPALAIVLGGWLLILIFSPALAILLGGWLLILIVSLMHRILPEDGFLGGVFAPKRTFSMYSQDVVLSGVFAPKRTFSMYSQAGAGEAGVGDVDPADGWDSGNRGEGLGAALRVLVGRAQSGVAKRWWDISGVKSPREQLAAPRLTHNPSLPAGGTLRSRFSSRNLPCA